ncbi:hypothetical protein HUT18_11440 [Streptomyces sp. NA04227]|uniref:hypothetical protein n=1 Tax=Streptomyces sp. NA04227 TaxID=2742136 RepID=UPI001591292C|nr:hypothetical protein [Streptomyces sp. NA04227]QKW06913.1 hypothetical protein HUT18_11440 [Streptomyces sp. NA04227]
MHDVPGPVIHDPGGQCVYFLVPPDADWVDVPGTELLAAACWLLIPAPERTNPPGPYWVRPPDGLGALVDPGRLRDALTGRAATA